MPTPAALQRDRLFEWDAQGLQLEFVVDNLAVCGLANGTLTARNSQNEETIARIRKSVSLLYTTCSYKGGFLDPVDWRAREWNHGLYYLANYALTVKTDGGNLTRHAIRSAMAESTGLQFFSDGGYIPGCGGAAGVQLLAYGNQGDRRVVGYSFKYVPSATSAFDMEILGLEMATSFVEHAFLQY